MAKITFMGAGSTIFAKNVLGDSMHCDSLKDVQIALYNIDPIRLRESQQLIEKLNKNINNGKAKITAHIGVENRKVALKDADFVVNAIQVGGYELSTVIDLDIPNKYGLRQTIADRIGIGGNVVNNGVIPNLPSEASVEVSCLVDSSGIQGCSVGSLPEQLAALNRTYINVHLLTIEAAITGKKEHIYHAAMLAPHTRAELTLDEIRNMCDDLIEAHGDMIPKFI